MADRPINLVLFSNEDFQRDFVLNTGTQALNSPLNLSTAVFYMRIIDVGRTSAIIDTLTSLGPVSTHGSKIVIVDPVAGRFGMRIPAWGETLPATMPQRIIKYDLVVQLNGAYRRLWGGNVAYIQGLTPLPTP